MAENKWGWMVYPRSTMDNPFGNNAFEWMVKSAKLNGIDLEIVFLEDIIIKYGGNTTLFDVSIGGVNVKKPDFVFMRCYDMAVGLYFESMGIRVFNKTDSMFISRDKILTGVYLSNAGIDVPKTLIYGKGSYEEISADLGERFIVKDNFGMKGEGVFLVENKEDFDFIFKNASPDFKPVFQEFVDSSYGTDIRVYTLGDRALGCVQRVSKDDFKSNLSQGGSVKNYQMTEEIETMAVKASKVLGLEFAGVDLLFAKEGFKVCEVNGNAGFRTISSVRDDIDMGYEIFKYIKSHITV